MPPGCPKLLMLFFVMNFDLNEGGDVDEGLFRLGLTLCNGFAVDIDNGTGTSKLDWYR